MEGRGVREDSIVEARAPSPAHKDFKDMSDDELMKYSNKKGDSAATEAATLAVAAEWYNKACALWNDGEYTDPPKAIEYLKEAIREKPDYAAAWGMLGLDYSNLKRHNDMMEAYRQVVRIDPNNARGWFKLGLIYFYGGNSELPHIKCYPRMGEKRNVDS